MRNRFASMLLTLISTSAMAGQRECDPVMSDQAWTQCAVCHSLKLGDSSQFGPNLHGVLGRRSGSLPGYVFSPALANSFFVWTASKLDVFLTGPQILVPGSRMPYRGLADAQVRDAIICKLANSTN